MSNLAFKNGIVGATMGMALIGAGLAAQAGTVSVSDFSDPTPDALFLLPTETSAVGNITTFTIGLAPSGFAAVAGTTDVVPVDVGSTSETISFNLVAAAGQKIVSISYTETGQATLDSGTVAIATGGVTANLHSQNFPSVIFAAPTTDFGWTLGPAAFDFSALSLTTVPVTITNHLSAIAFGPSGADVSISKNAPTLIVETAPIPLPPAVWMLGSALVGLVTVRRRRMA